MDRLEAIVDRWQKVEPQRVPLRKLKTDAAYQPRNPRLVSFKDSARWKADAAAHVTRLAGYLAYKELDPLLVAEIDGQLIIVDGHHRLMAHRRAGKCETFARVMELTSDDAVMASKLVNCGGDKLNLHDEQRRECAWQYLANLTVQGARPLPEGASRRNLGNRFGVGRETIRAMLRHLPHVNLADFTQEACDPGTDFPHWKYVKGNAIRDRFANVDVEIQEQHRDEHRAAKLAAIIEKDGKDAFLRSLRLLGQEAMADEAVALLEPVQSVGDDY